MCVGISKIWIMWWTMIYQQGVLIIMYYLIWMTGRAGHQGIAARFLTDEYEGITLAFKGWLESTRIPVTDWLAQYSAASAGVPTCTIWVHIGEKMHYCINNPNTASTSCNLKWTLHLQRAAKFNIILQKSKILVMHHRLTFHQ